MFRISNSSFNPAYPINPFNHVQDSFPCNPVIRVIRDSDNLILPWEAKIIIYTANNLIDLPKWFVITLPDNSRVIIRHCLRSSEMVCMHIIYQNPQSPQGVFLKDRYIPSGLLLLRWFFV